MFSSYNVNCKYMFSELPCWIRLHTDVLFLKKTVSPALLLAFFSCLQFFIYGRGLMRFFSLLCYHVSQYCPCSYSVQAAILGRLYVHCFSDISRMQSQSKLSILLLKSFSTHFCNDPEPLVQEVCCRLISQDLALSFSLVVVFCYSLCLLQREMFFMGVGVVRTTLIFRYKHKNLECSQRLFWFDNRLVVNSFPKTMNLLSLTI